MSHPKLEISLPTRAVLAHVRDVHRTVVELLDLVPDWQIVERERLEAALAASLKRLSASATAGPPT